MAQLCTDFAPLSNLLSLLTLGSYKIFIPYILTTKGFRQRTARAYPFYFSAKISQEYPLPARRASTYSVSDRSEIRGKNFRKFLKAREKVWVMVVKTQIAGCFSMQEAPGEAESTTTGLGQKLLP
jgi:hypothetical protein